MTTNNDDTNVANNVTQSKVQDLTEQWKNDKLQNDWYYVRTTNGIEKWEYIKQSHGFGYYETEWVLEVLAPVPSYEELQEKQKSLKVLAEAYCKEKEENQQLKELLKECDNELKILRMLSLPMASKGALSECDDLLSKITNAIGEKK